MAESLQRLSFLSWRFCIDHTFKSKDLTFTFIFSGGWVLFLSGMRLSLGQTMGLDWKYVGSWPLKGSWWFWLLEMTKEGLEALENLKHSGLSNYLVFHQLDVSDPASITSLADSVKKQFGKLDILVSIYMSYYQKILLFYIYIFSWFLATKDFNMKWSFLCP